MPIATSLLAAALAFAPIPGELVVTGDPGSDMPAPASAAATVELADAPGAPPSAAQRLRGGSLGALELPAASPLLSPPALMADAHGEGGEAPVLLQVRNRRGVPLMAAGGALFVAGLILGGDVGTLMAVGGAAIGAWGLYVYF